MRQPFKIGILCCLLAASGCATLPTGPSVRVYPGSDKSFDQFQSDDYYCRSWAEQRISVTPGQIHEEQTVTGAALGTVLGAGLGALIGSASGNAGTGAAIGAGSGLLLGAAAGSDSGRVHGYEAQRRYDTYYLQCMYTKGHQVPGVATPRRYRRQYQPPPPPPPPRYLPPPDAMPAPPGTSPPDWP